MPYVKIADRDAAVSRYYLDHREKRLAQMVAYRLTPAGIAARERRRLKSIGHHTERIAPWLAAGCADCGSHERLHFHHLDPSTKRYEVTVMTTHGDRSVHAEIAKCVVVCHTCHIRRHGGVPSAARSEAPRGPLVLEAGAVAADEVA